MTIEAELQIIDATVDKVTTTHILLSTVTAHLAYRSAQYRGYRIDRLIPMSQPGVIIPSLSVQRTEVNRLPVHIQNKVRAALKSQEGKR